MRPKICIPRCEPFIPNALACNTSRVLTRNLCVCASSACVHERAAERANSALIIDVRRRRRSSELLPRHSAAVGGGEHRHTSRLCVAFTHFTVCCAACWWVDTFRRRRHPPSFAHLHLKSELHTVKVRTSARAHGELFSWHLKTNAVCATDSHRKNRLLVIRWVAARRIICTSSLLMVGEFTRRKKGGALRHQETKLPCCFLVLWSKEKAQY